MVVRGELVMMRTDRGKTSTKNIHLNLATTRQLLHARPTLMTVQEIANLLTAGLGAATVWLAIETRRMATASKAAIDLAVQPYLSLRGTTLSLGKLQDLSALNQGATRIGVRLYNPGKVLIKYDVVEMTASIAGLTESNPIFYNTKGVLHPDEEIAHLYPLIKSSKQILAPTEGEVWIRVQFWSVEARKKSVTAKYQLNVTSQNNHEWLLLEGPTYE